MYRNGTVNMHLVRVSSRRCNILTASNYFDEDNEITNLMIQVFTLNENYSDRVNAIYSLISRCPAK